MKHQSLYNTIVAEIKGYEEEKENGSYYIAIENSIYEQWEREIGVIDQDTDGEKYGMADMCHFLLRATTLEAWKYLKIRLERMDNYTEKK